jgi:anti-sigma factor RsiW
MKEFDYDMINRYLDGEMNAEELETFEAAMLQDSDLKNEVELLKDVNTTLKIKLYPGEC